MLGSMLRRVGRSLNLREHLVAAPTALGAAAADGAPSFVPVSLAASVQGHLTQARARARRVTFCVS